MFELREAVLKAGLKINSSSQSIQGKEVLVADSLYGGRVMARYLFLCCNAEFWHNSVKELSEELEEFIQELYFTRRSDLSWNLYFAVVLEPDEYKKLTIYEKNLFMADTEFTRKLIVPTDRFSEMIPVGQIMSKNSDENALLPVMEWRTALEEAGVSSIWLEAFDAGKLETFFSTGSAGENKRERQIKRVPSADEEEIPCSIQSIRIPKDFRPHCYDRDWTLEFPRISLFYGPNGAGKTSILEAIELAMTGSVRGMSREGAERSLNSPVILNAVTKKGQKTVSSNDKQKNMKVREQTWYGTRFDRFTRSQLSPLFHTYNQFSVDDVYLFCQGGQQPDYSGRFSQILFGNEASAIQNHWQRYREETKQRLRKLEEERRGVDNRLAILQKGENSDREALSAYVKHSDFAFDLHDAELPHTICDAVARIQTIYDKLSWSGELPVPDDIPMLLQKSQGETDRLRKLLDEKKAEEERQLGELKAVYWREEENEKEQDRIQDCLTRLARLPMPMELARFLSKKPDFLTQYAEVKEEAQKAQSFQRELELFSTCFGELKTCKEPESELSGAEDTYRRLTERLREAEKTLQSSNEKVRQAQEKTNAMTRVLSEISTAGEQYLKLNENLKACPMCGRPATKETILSYLHKTTGTWTGELSGAMLLRQHCQDAYDRLKDDVKAAEKRVELWRKFQDADQYARERGLDAQLIGRVPQVPVHRVYEVFHLDAQAARQRGEAEAKLAYLWQELDGHERIGTMWTFLEDVDTAHRESVKALNEMEWSTCGNGPDALLSAVIKAQEELNKEQAEVNSNAEELDREIKRREAALRTLKNGIPDLSERLDNQMKKAHELELLHKLWEQAKPYLKAEVSRSGTLDWGRQMVELRKMATEAMEAEKKQSDIEEALRQWGEIRKKEENGQRLLEVLNGLKTLEFYADGFIKKHIKQISRIFLQMHTPQEYAGLDMRKVDSDDERLFAVRSTGEEVFLQDMSTGQKTAVVLSVLMEMHLSMKSVPHFLLIDEPVSNVDDLNILSMMDFFRELVVSQHQQLFITTANRNVARLFRRKFSFLNEDYAEFAISRSEDMKVSIIKKCYDQDRLIASEEL